MLLSEELQRKWQPVLDHDSLPAITDPYKRAVTAAMLENQEQALKESGEANGGLLAEEGTMTGSVSNYDPVMISLVRRAMPNLIAYDICGVQPMTGPTGLIFAMRAIYANTVATGVENPLSPVAMQGPSGTAGPPDQGSSINQSEALYWEANTGFSGTGAHDGPAAQESVSLNDTGSGIATSDAEVLSGANFHQMGFNIDKVTVTAKSRALKAEYTIELAQDLKAIHGLDAETELSNILSAEILAEINREVVRKIVVTANPGAQTGTATAGQFDLDVDANGRWSVEKFKGLMFQLEREANQIAKYTRRGKGNLILCSSDVASALSMAGVLDNTPALASNNLQVDDTGNTFAGVLNGRFKVFIDPYHVATNGFEYACVGYRGSSAYDAGFFYCPYVPLQMVRAVGEDDFQPKIGFKTRYGLTPNPFAVQKNPDAATGALDLEVDKNAYYRRVMIKNLL